MPDPIERKERPKALERAKRYYSIPEASHPWRLWPPLKELTDKMRGLMNTKNYVRITTQLDKNQYIMQQYYIYCDEDIWMCGDAFVMNQNPDKKILIKVFCTKTRTDCLCFNEDSKTFISVCPSCKRPHLFIMSTPFKCSECNFELSWEQVNDLPYAKIPCELCPVEMENGLDDLVKMKKAVMRTLQPRQHIINKTRDEIIGSVFSRMVDKKEGKKNGL